MAVADDAPRGGNNTTGYPDFPNGLLTLLFQVDQRIAMLWLRRDVGEDVLPPWFPGPAAAMLVGGLLLRLWIAGELEAGGLEAVDWSRPDLVLWVLFIGATLCMSVAAAHDTSRRRRQNRERIPTAFVGWSRLMSWSAYEGAGGAFERGKVITRAQCRREPVAGLGAAFLIWQVSPSLALYVAVNVLLLLIDSAALAEAERRAKLRLGNAIAERAYQQHLLEQLRERGGQRQKSAVAQIVSKLRGGGD